jgi:hypothetical protein
MISASFAFTRPVISRLSLVLDTVKRVCLISGVDYGQFCTLRFPVMGARLPRPLGHRPHKLAR